MSKIYIVTAEQGQSIHMKKWTEKLFSEEDKANQYVVDMTKAEKDKVKNMNAPIFYHIETMELE